MNTATDLVRVGFQNAANAEAVPEAGSFRVWVNSALARVRRSYPADALLTIRIVSEAESTDLNSSFRNVPRPTNVLAFPVSVSSYPGHAEEVELGDLAICAAVVEREAAEQGKPVQAHFAHMAVHGVLHLVGYDHSDDGEAREMEALEQQVMADLGLPDPYRDENRDNNLRQA